MMMMASGGSHSVSAPVAAVKYVPQNKLDFFSFIDSLQQDSASAGSDKTSTHTTSTPQAAAPSTPSSDSSSSIKRISTLTFDPSQKPVPPPPVLVKQEQHIKEEKDIPIYINYIDGNKFLCGLCGQPFFTRVSLNAHMTFHAMKRDRPDSSTDFKPDVIKGQYTGERPYKCQFCTKRFYTRSNLRVHRKVHITDSHLFCTLCDKAFALGIKLYNHIRADHKGENVDAADICSRAVRSKSLDNRLVNFTGDATKPYKCSLCGKAFRKLYRAREHTRGHSGKKPYQCSVCSKGFTATEGLARHLRNVHKGVVTLPTSPVKMLIPKAEPADVGNEMEWEMRQASLNIPVQQDHDPNQINFVNVPRHRGVIEVMECDDDGGGGNCHSTVSTLTRYSVHVKAEPAEGDYQGGGDEPNTTVITKAFQCSQCGDMFFSGALLNKHISTRHKLLVQTKCPICQREFKLEPYLKRHLATHMEEKAFKCSLCPKSYRRQYRLANHMRMHSGEKPYHCSVCGKSFTVAENMYRHIRKMHKGEGKESAAVMVKQIQEMNRQKKQEEKFEKAQMLKKKNKDLLLLHDVEN